MLHKQQVQSYSAVNINGVDAQLMQCMLMARKVQCMLMARKEGRVSRKVVEAVMLNTCSTGTRVCL